MRKTPTTKERNKQILALLLVALLVISMVAATVISLTR
jgi:hypothetical protein